jgi:hypothetical protein
MGALIERVRGTYFFDYKIIKIYPYGFNDDDNGRLICQLVKELVCLYRLL